MLGTFCLRSLEDITQSMDIVGGPDIELYSVNSQEMIDWKPN